MSKQQKQKLRKQRSEKLRAIVSSEGEDTKRFTKIPIDERHGERIRVIRKAKSDEAAAQARRRTASHRLASSGGSFSRRPGFVGSKHCIRNSGWICRKRKITRASLRKSMASSGHSDAAGEKKTEICAMAFNIAGAPLRDIEHVDLEYGIEDWGSFENCVDGLAARSGDDGGVGSSVRQVRRHGE